MSLEEKGVFELLTLILEVKDAFLAFSRIWYSWNNRRNAGMHTLTRLDRIYILVEMSSNTKSDEYTILGDSILSDHLPVRRRVVL